MFELVLSDAILDQNVKSSDNWGSFGAGRAYYVLSNERRPSEGRLAVVVVSHAHLIECELRHSFRRNVRYREQTPPTARLHFSAQVDLGVAVRCHRCRQRAAFAIWVSRTRANENGGTSNDGEALVCLSFVNSRAVCLAVRRRMCLALFFSSMCYL